MNKQKKNYKSTQAGSAMVIAIFLMAAILFITMSISQIVMNGLQMSKTQVFSTKAFFAAEAAAEKALWYAREWKDPILNEPFDIKDSCNDNDYIGVNDIACGSQAPAPCCDPDDRVHTTLDNNATFTIQYDRQYPDTVLECIGEFQGTRRVIEIRYLDY